MLTDTVKQLQNHKNDVLAKIESLQSEVSKIEEAIAALASVNGDSVIEAEPAVVDGRKTRWATYKKAAPAAAPDVKSKPKFSAAGIAKIRAAQKLRWAKYNAAKAGKK